LDAFSKDWKSGISGLASRGVMSAALGLPLVYAVEKSGIDILNNYKMLVVAAGVYFILPFTQSVEMSTINPLFMKTLSMLPF
jgi:hypothetical protein